MPTDIETSGLISYQEAAALLGRQEQTIRSLVYRGHLHAIPNPRDRRYRLLSRKEVEDYAVKYIRNAIPAPLYALAPSASPNRTIELSPQMLGAIGGGVVLVAVLIFLVKDVDDPAMRAILVGAIVGIALLALREWQEQGRISQEQRRRLEQLAQTAGADPDPFVSELEQVLAAS